jgi:DNA mismatch repair protein MutS
MVPEPAAVTLLVMPFRSILFGPGGDPPAAPAGPPAFFTDLNLDQIGAALTRGLEQYELMPYFLTPLPGETAVAYRHQVFRDLRRTEVREVVTGFAGRMEAMRQCLARAAQLHHPYQQQRWFLDAAATYGRAVRTLTEQLQAVELTSDGLRSLRDHLGRYTGSAGFQQLTSQVGDLLGRLGQVRYCVHIRGSRVRVTRYTGEADYGADVEQTFAKFGPGEVKDYRVPFRSLAEMDQVEGQILDCVAQLYPDLFADLTGFGRDHPGFADTTVTTFDREVQFYLAYLAYIRPLESAGLPFCFPEVSPEGHRVRVEDGFDLALASKLAGRRTVVGNSLHLDGPERAIVVTGPNQGGKTTFARMAGQLFYLASLGVPVPGRLVQLFLPDQIFGHFDTEENPGDFQGRLESELIRMREILHQASHRSVVVMNESFASTTLADASFLGAEILGQLIAKDLVCVYVTFIDQLASLSPACVSMVAGIDPDDPAERTFRVVRKPADGLAYAAAIAGRHGLSYERLRERIAP